MTPRQTRLIVDELVGGVADTTDIEVAITKVTDRLLTVSFTAHCKDQEEVDYYWERLTANGGEESQCGWLKDRFGLSWQILPDRLFELVGDPDPARAAAATQAMHGMRRIVIAELEEAAAESRAI